MAVNIKPQTSKTKLTVPFVHIAHITAIDRIKLEREWEEVKLYLLAPPPHYYQKQTQLLLKSSEFYCKQFTGSF